MPSSPGMDANIYWRSIWAMPEARANSNSVSCKNASLNLMRLVFRCSVSALIAETARAKWFKLLARHFRYWQIPT